MIKLIPIYRLLISAILLLMNLSLHAQPSFVAYLMNDNHHQIFQYFTGDEFNEDSLNSSFWRTEYPWGRVLLCNNEQQLYLPDNVSVSRGFLFLKAGNTFIQIRVYNMLEDSAVLTSDCNYDGIPDTVGINLRTFHYTSGMVYSKPTFKYGLFESKFKIPEGKRLWPAFWLFGHQGEIDVCEFRCHDPLRVHFDVHQGKSLAFNGPAFREKTGGWIKLNQSVKNHFITMGVIWEENKVTWLINGIPAAIEYHKFENPMSLVANLAIAGECPSLFCPGPDENTKFPADFTIDFIRAFSTLTDNDTIAFEFLTKDTNFVPIETDTNPEIRPSENQKYMKTLKKIDSFAMQKMIARVDFFPLQRQININTLYHKKNTEIIITDLSDHHIISRKLSAGKKEIIDIAHLAAGNYLLLIKNNKSQYQLPFKIIQHTEKLIHKE